jgi:hypothetical protein
VLAEAIKQGIPLSFPLYAPQTYTSKVFKDYVDGAGSGRGALRGRGPRPPRRIVASPPGRLPVRSSRRGKTWPVGISARSTTTSTRTRDGSTTTAL